MEKSQLPLVEAPPRAKPARRSRKAALYLIPLAVAAYFTAPSLIRTVAPTSRAEHQVQEAWASHSYCAQPDPLFPSDAGEAVEKAYNYISTSAFRNATIKRLSGAVKVKSESFDDLGEIGKDPRWDVFYDFHKYLEATFPLIYERLQVEKINTHGLLYTWKGSDDSLKPTLLMAHQDTVPVPPETIGAWTYPPWSGEYDGTHIWGRGSSDCKNQLIAVMESVELLLEAKFEPKRTVVLSFGFDEECSGHQGAGRLAPFLHERYGDDGLAVIVDEGAGFEQAWGTLFAKPATGEKGYTDVHVTVRMPGGHSSIPQDHTSIGVLSELITLIEARQYPTRLADENPYYTQLHCGAEHSPEFPHALKKLLARRASGADASNTCKAKPDRLALEAAKQGPDIKYLMQTSQAVDVITGGIKTNALPERVTVVVNHRINVGETPQVVWDRLTRLAGGVAKKYGLDLHAFDGKEEPSSINLDSSATTLEVAPVTPADGPPFRVVAGTTRALYGKEVVVAPGIMTGNTDTRYYWNLTKHIFRFGPGYDPTDGNGLGGIHTVNEKVSVVNHINAVKWFTLFVRNMDEVEL
jgi:Gly-Xaa carboxypeptidase